MLTASIQGFTLGASLIIAIGSQNAFVLRQGLKKEHVLAVCTVCFVCDAGLILLGVVFTALAHTLFIRGMLAMRAQLASIIACLEPVYGILFALVVLHAVPSTREIIGGVVIIGAIGVGLGIVLGQLITQYAVVPLIQPPFGTFSPLSDPSARPRRALALMRPDESSGTIRRLMKPTEERR